MRYWILIACILSFPATAFADCVFDGKRYEEGDRRGVLVCEDGKWVLKP